MCDLRRGLRLPLPADCPVRRQLSLNGGKSMFTSARFLPSLLPQAMRYRFCGMLRVAIGSDNKRSHVALTSHGKPEFGNFNLSFNYITETAVSTIIMPGFETSTVRRLRSYA